MSPFRWTTLVFSLLIGLFVVAAPRSALSDGDASIVSVTAKLVEIPSKLPPDDLYDYAYVMRYRCTAGRSTSSRSWSRTTSRCSRARRSKTR